MTLDSRYRLLEYRHSGITAATPNEPEIEAAGVENTIMSTDLGQTGNIRPLEGFRLGIAMCLDLGYPEADIRKKLGSAATILICGPS